MRFCRYFFGDENPRVCFEPWPVYFQDSGTALVLANHDWQEPKTYPVAELADGVGRFSWKMLEVFTISDGFCCWLFVLLIVGPSSLASWSSRVLGLHGGTLWVVTVAVSTGEECWASWPGVKAGNWVFECCGCFFKTYSFAWCFHLLFSFQPLLRMILLVDEYFCKRMNSQPVIGCLRCHRKQQRL